MSERSDEQAGPTAPERQANGPAAPNVAGDPAATQGAQDEGAAGEGSPPAQDTLTAELQGLRDRYIRLAAEYDNYRKRTEKEKGESWGRAQAQLVQQLLDPLDDLQRVAHFNAETVSAQALLEGVQMVERKLLRLLESAGLEVLDASGQPFDPSVHEAIMAAPAERHEDDESVGEVFQKGYRFKGDLLRPARVQVRKFGA